MISPFEGMDSGFDPGQLPREYSPVLLDQLYRIGQIASELESGDYTSRVFLRSAEVTVAGPAINVSFDERSRVTGQARHTDISVINASARRGLNAPALLAREATVIGHSESLLDSGPSIVSEVRVFGTANPPEVNNLPLSRVRRVLRIVHHLAPLDVA